MSRRRAGANARAGFDGPQGPGSATEFGRQQDANQGGGHFGAPRFVSAQAGFRARAAQNGAIDDNLRGFEDQIIEGDLGPEN
ncbi:hypothetical protein AVO44_07875 [Ruegeria profundi]|uniref:Uncharacterized protein n=1 Tax=Ruegeria profundi TaxID=1685378 RepID=A0A0X3TWJ5_9RHOB|nr:hypothetical protein AVO44_07875 [Ruegeria profundi]